MNARKALPPVIWRGPRSTSSFSLTFDDGPHLEITPRILDILASHNARATFFLVGENAERQPDIVARMREEGHHVGSHGYAHRADWWRVPGVLSEDIQRGDTVLGEWISHPRLFRPPHGYLGPSWYLAARRNGYHCVLWNLAGKDWKSIDAKAVANRVNGRLRPGRIVLLHDCRARTGEAFHHVPDALEAILRHANERGLKAVTVPELIGGGS